MRLSTCPCIFCELIHGGGEVSICYEDSQALAFMDIQPVNAGHVLVVPREHYDPFSTCRRSWRAISLTWRCGWPPSSGGWRGRWLNVIVNSGAAAGRTCSTITCTSFRAAVTTVSP
jgi:histidine triad (HIT) family protein